MRAHCIFAERPPAASGLISNFQNLLIRDSCLINVEHPAQNFHSGRTGTWLTSPLIINLIIIIVLVLHLLEQKRIPGAEMDSSERDPPPRCHPDTRKELRCRINTWLAKPDRNSNMLWLLGPVGVGKSAVAQTIAEQCKTTGLLGAAFFFSRLITNCSDHRGMIPTLAYQLAVQHSGYKQVITRRLADDPALLDKNLRTQFRELVVEPFKTLTAQGRSHRQQPLLIVIDGLDECKDIENQRELIHLINDHPQVPLLWMICSRPEWHLKRMLSNADFPINCLREELSVDDAGSRRDVRLVLHDGFADIRRRFSDSLDDKWPSSADLQRLAEVASGFFILISTLFKHVGEEYNNPRMQLETFIQFINTGPAPTLGNPLHALDILYNQILSCIPQPILPTTKRILGFCIVYADNGLSASNISNFLGLNRDAFYSSLRGLHSVLRIPDPPHATVNGISFYHNSFAEFLQNSTRSGAFALNRSEVHFDVAVHAIRWYNLLIERDCSIGGMDTQLWPFCEHLLKFVSRQV